MSSVISIMAITACVYNRFSFTCENICNSINIYSIQPYNDRGCSVGSNKSSEYKLQTHESKSDINGNGDELQLKSTNFVYEPQVNNNDYSESESDSDSDSESDSADSGDTNSIITTTNTSECENKNETPSVTVTREILFEEFSTFVNPKPDDSLLWCAYIMIYGIEKFETVENYYTEGNTFKYKVVGDIRSKKALLKPHKLTLSKLEDSFVNKPFINLEAFYAIALTYNLSVCIIQGRKLFEIGRNNDDSNMFVVEKRRGKYGMYIFANDSSIVKIGEENFTIRNLKQLRIDYMRDKFWSMENISSPIRPLSAYKLPDLVEICTRLDIPTYHQQDGEYGSIGIRKRKTKNELYEAICSTI